MTRPTRQTYGRLLLFALLLLGVVTMHTPGHPSELGSAVPSPVGKHLSRQLTVTPPGHDSVSAGPSAMTGMDPASVCLAVLGPFTFLLLLAAGVGVAASARAVPPRPARLPREQWPNPPPPGLLLSRPSVLRI